ncbi:MAG: ATP-binding cassette domain-containing protein [Candidatus Falkowbacteria bacterium]
MLELKNISQIKDGREILTDISLAITPGEVLTLIGPSGGGKTSLLKVCALLDIPAKGNVVIDGVECASDGKRHVNPIMIWPKVTIIYQNLYLWPHLSAKTNIILPIENFASKQDKFDELCERFGLTEHLSKYPNQLSAGQKQRVAIVRALLLDPKYLLLDEITASLDVEQSLNVIEVLHELKNNSIGIILVTHHLEFAKNISDKIIFLENGRIIDTGGPNLVDGAGNSRIDDFVTKLRSI